MPVQTQLQQRRGTAASWTSTNPTLAAGEIGFETDTNKFKIGTGSTAWVSLAYASNVSPLTTKGDLYAFSTTNARLPVGANGDTIVADASTATGLRYNPQNALVNPVINGAYDIAQRGTSFTTIAGFGYTLDRWQSRTASGGGSVVTSQELTNDTTNLPNIQSCARLRRSTGNTDTAALQLQQAFESVNSTPFFGKTVTFSFYARKSANFTGALSAQLISGTGTDQSLVVAFSSLTTVASSSPSLTTTWTRYAATGTVGATVKQLGILFTSEFVGTAGSDDFFEVTGAQVDLGTYTASTAPTFRRSGGTIQGETSACQRYYYRNAPGAATDVAIGMGFGTNVVNAVISFPVSMRIRPTALEQSGTATDYAITDGGGTPYACSAVPAFGTATFNEARISYNFPAFTLTAGATQLTRFNTSAAFLGWSAEL